MVPRPLERIIRAGAGRPHEGDHNSYGIDGLRLVSSGEVINTSTFNAGISTTFSTVASGIVYIGFRYFGNIGWFSVDLGGIGGDVTFNVSGGQYGSTGESLTVGSSTPAVPGVGGLAALAIGATGLRGRRQRAAAG